MKKIYIYSEEEEKEIDKEYGYTQNQLDRAKSYGHFHYQTLLTDEKVFKFFEDRKKKKCSVCNTNLIWVKECSYVGLRHAGKATMGDYLKSYSVLLKKYCPNCKKIID